MSGHEPSPTPPTQDTEPQLSPLERAALQAEVARMNEAVTQAQLGYLTRRLQELVIENANLRAAAEANDTCKAAP